MPIQMPALVDPTDLAIKLLERVRTLEHVIVFDGEPGDIAKDSNGRVLPYLCVYSGVGDTTTPERLAQTQVTLLWRPQITCVAGYPDALNTLVFRVRDLLLGWSPLIDGVAMQPLRGSGSTDARPSTDPKMPRWWVPLLFRATGNRL